jgi:ligand-binding sensor domain-containing protein
VGPHRGQGVYRFTGDRVAAYTMRDGFPGDWIHAIYQDVDGDLWIGTNGRGVAQLRDGRFRVYTTQDGLADNYVSAIYEDTAKRVWTAPRARLSRPSGPWPPGTATSPPSSRIFSCIAAAPAR